jgi:hypothetical protein
MLRVCGADGEQKPFAQRQCWCRGLFCGKGGARLSIQFRRDVRKSVTAASRAQFEELVAQMDLFDPALPAAPWLERVARATASRG